MEPRTHSPRRTRRTRERRKAVEIRYALLDSRRYPAMYLSYQLFLSSHRRRRRALPCISFAFPNDFVAKIMRLIRSRRAVRTECCGRARSTVPFPVATKLRYKARSAANARCIFIAVHFLNVRDVRFFFNLLPPRFRHIGRSSSRLILIIPELRK